MPFRADELRQRFAASIEQGRMGHSYLLTGDRAESLENLALGLAGQVLAGAPQEHPDFHSVRPESKSRTITVLQIRELERELYLRPFIAPVKVAVIFDAERMCVGGAAAANAFLKTLEEPPAHTLILLTSGRSAMLLPTIISRCLRLDLGFEDIDAGAVHDPAWIAGWYTSQPNPALRAYARAQVMHEHWAHIRDAAETHLKESDTDVEEACGQGAGRGGIPTWAPGIDRAIAALVLATIGVGCGHDGAGAAARGQGARGIAGRARAEL